MTTVEDTEDVRLEDSAEILNTRRFDWCEDPDACVVDEDVEAVEIREQGFDLIVIADITDVACSSTWPYSI